MGEYAYMKELLRQLKAHMSTKDPWVLVYDNQGTFDDRVGECIVVDSGRVGHGSLLGVPLRREITFEDAYNLIPHFQLRVSREHLNDLIARIEYQDGGRKNVA